MICTWLNGVFCTPSRKRGVPADTIKGVLFFKILKKDSSVKQRSRKYFASSIRGVRHQLSLSLQRRRGGECRQREFLFFKIWEREVCFSKFAKRSFVVVKIIERPREFYVSYDTFLHHQCGRGEAKRFMARVSAIKGGLFFKKQNSIYHRCIVTNCAFSKHCSQDKGEKFF